MKHEKSSCEPSVRIRRSAVRERVRGVRAGSPYWVMGAAALLVLGACERPNTQPSTVTDSLAGRIEEAPRIPLVISHDVSLGTYFEFMDSLIAQEPALHEVADPEHMLVRANPWLIHRLKETDYYRLKAKGVESLDPSAEVVLGMGDTLWVPTRQQIKALNDTLDATVIDINIPEFKLRIREFGQTRHTFLIRVGRNEEKYLEMAGRVVDLRSQTGSGTIVRIEKDPEYRNPVDNQLYHTTRRDDGVVTGLPRIPFLEPELDGVRYGQLIHPTTNPETLGKAVSSGCLGTSEAAAWRIYYSAPLGTRVEVRYDLDPPTPDGDSMIVRDVYQRGSGGRIGSEVQEGVAGSCGLDPCALRGGC